MNCFKILVNSRYLIADLLIVSKSCCSFRGVLREITDSGPKGDYTVYLDFNRKRRYETLYSSIEKIPGCGFEEVGSLLGTKN